MKSALNKLIHQFSQRPVNEFKSFSKNGTSVAYLKVLFICECSGLFFLRWDTQFT